MKKWRFAAVLAVGIIGLCLFLIAKPLAALPTITWNPSNFTPEVIAGETTSTIISFSSSQKLIAAQVRVSPELEGMITVTPSSLGTVPPGQTISLAVTMSPAATMTPSQIQGTISLHRGILNDITYGLPLPATMIVGWQTFANTGGFTVAIPPNYIATEVDSAKTVLQPTPETREEGALPIVIEADTLRRGPALRDHLESLGIEPQNIQEVSIGGRNFLRSVDEIGEGFEDISFSILSPAGQVFYVSTFSSAFSDDPRFLAAIQSLGF